jgi:hypothetical protein
MSEKTVYRICIKDVLNEKWTQYFTPFTLTCGIKETILTGEVHDQAELFGILLKVRDAGLTLISVLPGSK